MAKMEPLETSTTLAFHGVSYVVTVCVRDQTLEIQVELDDASSAASALHQETCWTAQFPANYLEDLTRKTGNYKRFPVFVNMLLSAMTHRSDAVFIDLLTTADLELYRKRKLGRQGLQPRASSSSSTHATANANDSFESATTGMSSSTTSASTSQKRYLILTYAVEFDRVHYPLPLHLVDKPTPEILQRTIRRLRQQAISNSNKTTNDEELRALREENRCLKATLASYCGREEDHGNENGGDRRNARPHGKLDLNLQHELELSMRENKELIAIYQQLREDSSAEMARLHAEIRQLKLLRQNHDGAVDHKTERERLDARRRLNDSNAAAHEALLQLQEMKTQLEETQLKNKELLRQLAIARVKAGTTNHTPTPTRGVTGATRTKSRDAISSNGVATANGNRSVPRALRRVNSYERQFDSSDDEDVPGYRSSSGGRMMNGGERSATPQRRGFRRFDPTAYQQERQRKLQQRGASPAQRGGPGPSSRPRRVSGGAAGGYTSDSSAGGYSSAGSDASRGSARSTARGRSRVAYQHQRDAVDRLASPRSTVAPPSQTPSRSQIPRPRSQSGSRPAAPPRARSPSPARSSSGRTATSTPSPPPAAAVQSHARRPLNATARSQATAKTKSPATPKATPTSTTSTSRSSHRELPRRPPALLADTSLDSFSDIDDRLTALQQFLKQAKQQGSTATSAATTTTATTTVSPPLVS